MPRDYEKVLSQTEKRKRLVTFGLNADQMRKLNEYCAWGNWTKASVVRAAISAWVEKMPPTAPPASKGGA